MFHNNSCGFETIHKWPSTVIPLSLKNVKLLTPNKNLNGISCGLKWNGQ